MPNNVIAGRQPVAKRLDYVDGLRGLAILMVFMYHSWNEANRPGPVWWNPLGSGYIGVELFLVLSGFCLYWPLVKGNGKLKEPTLLEFAARRARRILPPYYVALFCFLCSVTVLPYLGLPWQGKAQIRPFGDMFHTAIWHGLMLHNLRPGYVWDIAGPFWSLALEVNLYIAMPILVVIARRYGIISSVTLAALVTISYRIAVNEYIGGAQGWSSAGYEYGYVLGYALPGMWLLFALGMWAATLVNRRIADSNRIPYGLLSALLISSGIVATKVQGQFGPLPDPMFGAGFLCMILAASRESLMSKWSIVGRVLRARPLVGLGTVSYSFYLIHQPLLGGLVHFGAPRHMTGFPLVAECLCVFLPVSLGVARLYYILVERHFIHSPVSSPGRAVRRVEAPLSPSNGGGFEATGVQVG